MKKETNELLEELIKQLGKEGFYGLRDALFKRGVEALPNAELTAHFGYNKQGFPTDDTALKSIYLAAQQIRKKW